MKLSLLGVNSFGAGAFSSTSTGGGGDGGGGGLGVTLSNPVTSGDLWPSELKAHRTLLRPKSSSEERQSG